MKTNRFIRMPPTAWIYPLVAALFYLAASSFGFSDELAPGAVGIALALLLVPVLFGAIFAAVYHAEIIAHRTGEPYGTLILTASVTVIEVALIASVMMSGAEGGPTLARDTVYAVVMTVCAGLAGVCILAGGLRYREQSFRVPGVNAYLTVLMVLATLTLILPNFTRHASGPSYSSTQLAFVAITTLLLYGAFLYIQTVRHRDYFIVPAAHHDWHFEPTPKRLAISSALLVLALVSIVLLSKKFAVIVELGRVAVGAPPQATGLVVAILILLPDGIAALQAARNDA
ncbi:MAG: calcium:proton antiporter, partial [Bradyrhizobium sp.]